MESFDHYLKATAEVGYIEKVVHSIVYVSGIPSARVGEIVIFENGDFGQIVSLGEDLSEVLILSKGQIKVEEKVARTGEFMQIPVGEDLLGRVIDPLGNPIDRGQALAKGQSRPIDTDPPGVLARKSIDTPLETGVALVDLVIPLGKGQRELVIGDRKTGKTGFLLQTIVTQAKKGTVCVYAAVGKKKVEVAQTLEAFTKEGIAQSVVTIYTTSADPAGLIFIAPYAAMTIAEYFRDQGRDVLIVLDDLTAHAKYYREITLLARRFPGRSSYPGDIFYIHARLLERAGKFAKGTISALPVAETILGDLSGYIQTNLMAMTDGHIFFDADFFNRGRRPAINPFLSVTRVGQQAQTPLVRDLSRTLSAFLVKLEKLREFMHFGAELSEAVQRQLALGDRILTFFGQSSDATMPLPVSIMLLAYLWAGFWKEGDGAAMIKQMSEFSRRYQKEPAFAGQVDKILASCTKFNDLVAATREKGDLLA